MCATGASLQWDAGHSPLRNFGKMHFVRFEGIVMRKQAAKSELKNAVITEAFKLQNGFFLTQRLLYMCILQC